MSGADIMSLNFKSLKELSYDFSLLYIEDDSDIRESTASIFEHLFHTLGVAEDGKDGLNQYIDYYTKNSKYFDIIISDIQMPQLNGIGLSKAILEINENQKIIIISAHNDSDYLEELKSMKIEAYIQKPLSSQEMLEALYNICTSIKSQ